MILIIIEGFTYNRGLLFKSKILRIIKDSPYCNSDIRVVTFIQGSSSRSRSRARSRFNMTTRETNVIKRSKMFIEIRLKHQRRASRDELKVDRIEGLQPLRCIKLSLLYLIYLVSFLLLYFICCFHSRERDFSK